MEIRSLELTKEQQIKLQEKFPELSKMIKLPWSEEELHSLSKSWEEYCKKANMHWYYDGFGVSQNTCTKLSIMDIDYYPSKGTLIANKARMILLNLRDEWRQGETQKLIKNCFSTYFPSLDYHICYNPSIKDWVVLESSKDTFSEFSFKTEEQAKDFLNTFKSYFKELENGF